jgi:hypothetical protein
VHQLREGRQLSGLPLLKKIAKRRRDQSENTLMFVHGCVQFRSKAPGGPRFLREPWAKEVCEVGFVTGICIDLVIGW